MENSCKCSAWIKFVSERDTLVAEVKKREKKLDFSAYPEPKELSDVKKKRILSLYRNLADKKPDEIWYKNVIKNLNF